MSEKLAGLPQSDILFKDRLLREAMDALSTLYSARRRLVGFTGSGLSLIYGGLTWNEAVVAIIEDTLAELQQYLESGKPPPSTRQILLRHVRMIEVYSPERSKGALVNLQHEDRMVALDVCEDARETLRKYGCNLSSANAYFAELVQDDTIATKFRLAERFSGYQGAKQDTPQGRREFRRKFAADLLGRRFGPPDIEARRVAQVAAATYSFTTFDALSRLLPKAARQIDLIAEALRAELTNTKIATDDAIPIDRRSLMAPFIALLSQPARERLASTINSRSMKKPVSPPPRPFTDPLRRLVDPLMIKRFVTLNYDWELERLLMFPDRVSESGRTFRCDQAKDDLVDAGTGHSPGGSMTRRMPDGQYVTSEVYEPNTSARIFEFALNSPDHAAYILHLHGRADHPEGMVAREPDYHRTYRRESSNPRSLERALDVALTGNPILFVGIGLREAEITRAFRQLVAEGRVTPDRPAFVLRANRPSDDTHAWREQASFYQQFGLHVLPYGHPRRGAGMDLSRHVKLIDELKELAHLDRPYERGSSAPPPLAEDDYAILASMPADFEMVQWIARLVRQPWTLRRNLQALMSLSPRTKTSRARCVIALEGMRDYLDRLGSRIESQALTIELDLLAEDISQSVAAGEKLPSPRETDQWAPEKSIAAKTAGGRRNALWLRHINLRWINDPDEASLPILQVGEKAIELPSLLSTYPAVVVVGAPHIGKGALMRALVQDWKETGPDLPTVIINLSFAVEIDGVIAQVYQFLAAQKLVPADSPRDRLNRISAAIKEAKPAPVCRIMLAGLERLFDLKGACIAPDLDRLLQDFATISGSSAVRVVFVGTPVLERWLKSLQKAAPTTFSMPTVCHLKQTDESNSLGIGRSFIRTLERAMPGLSSDLQKRIHYRMQIAHRQSSRESRVLGLLQIVLDHWRDLLQAADPENENLDFGLKIDLAVLRFLSFVTAPVELSALQHVPNIRQILRDARIRSTQYHRELDASMQRLSKARLVIEIASRFVPAGSEKPEDRDPRYCLHRVVLREMRDRLGMPVGDALLSNTFTLTLAASLPADVSIPDNDVRQDIEEILSSLRGAWKDSEKVDRAIGGLREHIDSHAGNPHDSRRWRAEEALSKLTRQAAMTTVDMHSALRASSNLMRSFFSATTLVMLAPETVNPLGAPVTPFDQHKRRIRKMFVTLAELQRLDGSAFTTDEDRTKALGQVDTWFTHVAEVLPNASRKKLREAKASFADVRQQYHKKKRLAPLYGGEIVWLHNERGVISLIQGDLYEATYSFDRALEANHRFKGEGRGNNRNRIDVNRSLLLIERGMLSEARALLHEVRKDLTQRVARELVMIDPIAIGYLGLIAHLNGRTDEAREHYTSAIRGLVETEQLRALSLFQMRRASLLGSTGKNDEALEDVNAAIRSAEACCQIDVLWRSRILRSTIDRESRDRDHVGREAFIAAERLGLVRVSVEALMARTEAAMMAGNPDAAADFVAQAMARATKSGMTLRRIALRVVMGRVMLRQQNPNAEWLIRRAIAHADRIGYQSCVQMAQEALLNRGKQYLGHRK